VCVCVRVAERNMTELFKTKKKEKSFVHLVLKRYKKKKGEEGMNESDFF